MSSLTKGHLASVLYRRLFGRVGALRGAALVAAVAFFAFAANIYLVSQSLTPSEKVESTLGKYGASVSRLSIVIPPGHSTPSTIPTGDGGVDVRLVAPDFPLYSLVRDGLVYQEADWTEHPFPASYHLRAGRWPSRSGEVVLVGSSFDRPVHVGDRLSVLASRGALTVVGLANPLLERRQEVLAAPGTWAGLEQPTGMELNGLAASPTFMFATRPSAKDVSHLVSALAAQHLADDDATTRAAFQAAVLTPERAQSMMAKPWINRSPVVFWAPVALLTPTAALLGYFVLLRRVAPLMRLLARAGVDRGLAVAVVWAVVATWMVIAAAAGALIGSVVGYAVARRQLFNGLPGARWEAPWQALTAAVVGLVVGLSAGALLLASRVPGARTEQRAAARSVNPAPSRGTRVRRSLLVLLGLAALGQLWRIQEATDGLTLSVMLSVGAGLVAPDLLRAVLGDSRSPFPSRSLTSRLARRSMHNSAARVGATCALIAVALSLSVGMITIVATDVAADRKLHWISSPLPGQVALDQDDTPTDPVPKGVIAAATTVRALAKQNPVELWPVGSRRNVAGEGLRLVDQVGVNDQLGLVMTVRTPGDLERLAGRPLSTTERSTLEGGGALVIDSRIDLARGSVRLTTNDGHVTVATVPARRARLPRTPWWEAVPAVLLTATAQAHGLPVVRGALIYTDVPQADAQRVLDALADHGINPENAEIHHSVAPVLPAAALAGSAAGLFVLLLILAMLATSAQVTAMRPWIARLTHLGVPRGWTRRILLRTYGLILALAVPLGILAGLLPLAVTKVRIPALAFTVPWAPIATLVASLIAAVAAAAWLASIRLAAAEALGWRDLGE